jgi:catechol-2,3-dioxygenase
VVRRIHRGAPLVISRAVNAWQYGYADLRGGAEAMEASAISHIAICTRDMEKSLAFYRDILGMKVLFDGLSAITPKGMVP